MGFHRNQLSVFLLGFALFGMAVVAFPVVYAATLTVVNNDGVGEGFNDPTVVVPVGGNTGTTIGAQRLIAFQHAADIWGGLLSSAVTIRVGAQFNPLTCNATSAILGSAGPSNGLRDFVGAPVAATWYPIALANALHGSDLDPSTDDISATFASTIGTPGCLTSSGWYYGLDGNPPSGKIDFVSVLVHELGHGLGFLTFVDTASGAKALGFNDTYMLNLEDHGATPSDYPSMTNTQRVTASTHTGNLHWTGANVRAASGVLTAGKVGDHVRMYAPSSQQLGSSVSHWDTALTPNQIMEPIYTGSLHTPVLELPLFQDIGWTLLASPVISVTPSSQDFGTVTVGSFADRSFTVQNTGGGTLAGTASASAPFSIISGASYSLGAGASQGVTVRFSPTAATTFAGNVTFTGGGGASRAITGTGVVPVTYTLTMAKSGTGTGTVTSSPAGIACGAACSASYPSGASVGLTATPAAGSTFAGWSGACSGTGTCTVTMNSATSVTATFALADEGFPVGGAIPAGWVQPAGSNAPWVVTNDTAYAGTLSLKSGAIGNSQKSELSYTANFSGGNVSFARKVSSELNFDFLEFYIDGVLQNRWSGELDWAVVSFALSAGTHTLLWRYVKNGSVSSGSDAAWIDGVQLPAATPSGRFPLEAILMLLLE